MTTKETINAYIEKLVEQHKLLKTIATAKKHVAALESADTPNEEQIRSGHIYIDDQNLKSEEIQSRLFVLFNEFFSSIKEMSISELTSLREELYMGMNPKKAIIFKLEKYGMTEELTDLQDYITKTEIIISHIDNMIANKKVMGDNFLRAR